MRPSMFLMKGTRPVRPPQNPTRVPFKMQMPFELQKTVSGKNSRLKERGCLYEISLVISCLAENNYEDKRCTKEVSTFNQCYQSYLDSKEKSREEARKGILTPYAKAMKFNQVNILLRKYPHV